MCVSDTLALFVLFFLLWARFSLSLSSFFLIIIRFLRQILPTAQTGQEPTNKHSIKMEKFVIHLCYFSFETMQISCFSGALFFSSVWWRIAYEICIWETKRADCVPSFISVCVQRWKLICTVPKSEEQKIWHKTVGNRRHLFGNQLSVANEPNLQHIWLIYSEWHNWIYDVLRLNIARTVGEKEKRSQTQWSSLVKHCFSLFFLVSNVDAI